MEGGLGLQVSVKWQGEVLHCAVAGEIDLHSASELRARLDEGLARSPSEIRLDLSATTFLDSSGLGVILGRYRRLREKGGQLSIEGAGGTVRSVLELSGLDQIIQIG